MRLVGKGHINRAKPVAFTFDGTAYQGFEGDTLASALLANDVRLVGRVVQIPPASGHSDRRKRRAKRAYDDWPRCTRRAECPRHSSRAVQWSSRHGRKTLGRRCVTMPWRSTICCQPFLSAGFYYKTFMWPKALWEGLYEPFIRNAAGLGTLSGKANPDLYEKAFAHCDVLVIGAGPAGLMAALSAGQGGAQVILADEDSMIGGRLNAEAGSLDGWSGSDWAASTRAQLEAMDNVRIMPRTTVTGAYDQGTYGALERVSKHRARGGEAPLECFWRIVTKRTVLCAGAIERPVAFPNNDRPGVMMASAARAYVNRWGVAPGARVTVFGNNDDAHQTVHDLLDAGVDVAALIDSRKDVSLNADVPVYAGGRVTATKGRHGLQEITVANSNGTHVIRTDCLAMSGGWNPVSASDLSHEWSAAMERRHIILCPNRGRRTRYDGCRRRCWADGHGKLSRKRCAGGCGGGNRSGI